jgi:Crassvirales DNA primase
MFDSSKIWTLNRETLLQKVSMSEILNFYLPGKGSKYKIICPFHKDSRPSLHVNLHKGTYNCYVCNKHGDGIQYVIERYKVDFKESLKIIANDFNLLDLKYDKKPSLEFLGIAKSHEQCEIKIKTRAFNKQDILYWSQFNISIDLCKRYNIYPITHYWLNERIFDVRNQIVYAYVIDGKFKIYKPYAIEYKWFSSLLRTDIFGLEQLNYSRRNLFITKSLKDIICLESFEISSIAPQAESILLPKELMIDLKGKFENIYTLFDYDNSGIHLAWQMRKLYGTIPLFFTDKIWNRKGGYKGCKDPAEFTINNKEEFMKLLELFK